MSVLAKQFRLIEGGGNPRPRWTTPRNIVIGRAAEDKNKIAKYRLSLDYINASLEHNRKQPLLDCWGSVIGEPPPLPNISLHEEKLTNSKLSSLSDATACFRGLKRPFGSDDRGWDYVAFISKPKFIFHFEPSMVCQISIKRLPDDLVFATYVRLDQSRVMEYPVGSKLAPIIGVITHWEFIECDERDDGLPIGYDQRYRKRLW